jgi:medium-chain acyl-[acyl-carrier-protein] hydrolase
MDTPHSSPLIDADALEPNIWEEIYHIRTYEVDCHNRLLIASMFNFMQDAASKHADALGVSVQNLLSENHTWLLSRLKIKISSHPGINDRIQVYTWPSGAQRLFALRDFELRNGNGQSIAAAVSAWLVVDVHRRRPVRITPVVKRLKPLEGRHILPDSLDKLPGFDHDGIREKKFIARYGDLDVNQHVNNVSFVEWVVEGVPSFLLNTSVLVQLEINFLAEAFYEDCILAVCRPENQDKTVYHHSLVRQQDGQELARARSVWQPL